MIQTAERHTLYDIVVGQNGEQAEKDIVNLFSQNNPFMQHATMVECNQNNQHTEVVTTSLPRITRRKFNEGINATKGTRAKITETCAEYIARAEIDKSIAELNKNKEAFFARENNVFAESIGNGIARDVIYGAKDIDNDGIIGLAERYCTLTKKNPNGEIPETAEYIIDAGGTGNNLTSIWFVDWGTSSSFLTYPQGSKGGLDIAPMEELYVNDANQKQFKAYVTEFKQKVGLCVKDLRTVVRIANIDLNAVATGSDAGKLTKLMIDAYVKQERKANGKAYVYCNRACYAQLWKLGVDRKNIAFETQQVEGKPVTMFQDLEVGICDAISNTEAQVI